MIAMWQRTMIVALVCGMIPASSGFGQVLELGLDNVGWENDNDTGPLLYREVNETDFVSVKAKISAQTTGFWSQAGVIVRAPNPIDAATGQENWQSAWSFRPSSDNLTFQANADTLGVEAELNEVVPSVSDLNYMRLDNMGGGTFQAYRGSGPDDAIVWTPMTVNDVATPQTNANLSGVNLQVGVAGGALGALTGAAALFDWVEIETTSQTFRDDFDYTRDIGVDGVSPGGIWTAVDNATSGGVNTKVGDLGRCVVCTWNTDGSGDFNGLGNWLGDTDPSILFAPNRNDATVVFGAASVAGPAVVYANTNATVKEIDFDNSTNTYVLGGAGSVTLDSDSGNALIHVISGSHEIQADVILADNVTATAEAGTTLNINASVVLNGNTFTTAGAGVINLNNGTVAVGGAGSGQLVNEGNLSGLAGLAGDYTQTSSGSLAVELGGGGASVVEVLGAAELDGTLDVSLADGFVPTVGQSYTVLTAQSVADTGLVLGGDAAKMFRLSVGGDSVSLLAVAVPEPATIFPAVAGLAFVVCIGWSRRTRPQLGVSLAAQRTACTLAALMMMGTAVAQADVLTYGPSDEDVTYTDEFDSFFDYNAANGGVPADTLTSSLGGTKSWTATYNAQNGGDPITFPDFPAAFEANGSYLGEPKPGVLLIEDQVVHPNTDDTALGVGFGDGDSNNAPFLFANVDAGDNFEATVKISNQTAGNWSYSGIIARRAGPTVGLGRGDTLDSDEAFVTMGSFRAGADDPNTPDVDESLNATVLIQNDGDFNDDGTVNEEEAGDGAVQMGFPFWVRVKKEASRFTALSSLDGINFESRGSVINPFLNTAGELLEIGPSHMAFYNGVLGTGEFDSFEITVSKQLIFQDARWTPVAAGAGSGDWNNGSNWDSDSAPGQVPNANTVDVELGDGNANFGPVTVYNNADVTIRSLTFDSTNKYAVSGTGSITLEPYSLHATDPTATFINVNSGEHEIQVKLSLSSDAVNNNRINAQPGSRLDINNSFDINGKTIFVQGGGTVNLNNNIDTGTSGTVIVAGGKLGGSGRVNGNLRNGDASNAGGIVSPGQSVGTLTVDGQFSQVATGTLAIELGGTAEGQYDRLDVLGALATLGGFVDVSYADGFMPTEANVGNTWDIITAPFIINPSGSPIALDPSDSPYYSLTCVNCTSGAPDILRLTLLAVPPAGLIGDYNNDDVVNAADYTVWRNNLGGDGSLLGANRDPANTGLVSAADYDSWKSHFGEASSGAGSGFGGGGSAVPEPAASLLCLLGATMIVASGRRRLFCRLQG